MCLGVVYGKMSPVRLTSSNFIDNQLPFYKDEHMGLPKPNAFNYPNHIINYPHLDSKPASYSLTVWPLLTLCFGDKVLIGLIQFQCWYCSQKLNKLHVWKCIREHKVMAYTSFHFLVCFQISIYCANNILHALFLQSDNHKQLHISCRTKTEHSQGRLG